MTLSLVVNHPQPAPDESNADIEVMDFGSVCIIKGLNDDGKAWVDELGHEPWQRTLGGVAVDFRYTEELVEAAVMDGMVVSAPADWQLPHPWRFSDGVNP